MIAWAARHAAASIAVSSTLAHTLTELGAPSKRVHVLRSGVDLTVVRSIERTNRR
jgi:hypothetical protein